MSQTIRTTILGTILGVLCGCAPLACSIVADVLSLGRGIGPYGPIAELLFVPLGMFTGLIGGVMYATGQRIATAASLPLGVSAGGIVAALFYGQSESFRYLVWLAPSSGALVAIAYILWSWSRRAERSATVHVHDQRQGHRIIAIFVLVIGAVAIIFLRLQWQADINFAPSSF